MKKTFKFLTVFLLALLGASNLWAADTETTIYYAVDASTVGCYTVKINANIGDNGTWRSSEMTKTSYTYNGKIIYTGKVNEKYGGVDCLQIQLYDGSTWKSQKQPYSSWTTSSTYSGKMYVHEIEKWVSYSTDASYTIYFADYYGWGNDHGGVKAYAWNSGCDYNAAWNGKAMTATDKTYNGKTIYSITINKRYTKVKISAANKDDYATGDLDCYSNSGKICIYNGSAYTWVTYNYDVKVTFNDGTSDVDTKTLLKGGTTTAPADPSKTGYTFGGWWNGDNRFVSSTTTINADITYTAKWTANQYTVTLDAKGGSGGSTSVTATYGAAMPSADMPTKTGYDFQGYYDADGSTLGNWGTQYYNNTGASAHAWDKDDDATLYAKWTETLYNITISGGTAASTTAGCVTTGQATAAAAAEGKKFDKWELGTGITLVDGCAVTDQTITFNASQASTVTATYADASKFNLNVVAGTGISAVTGEKLNQTSLPIESDITATVMTGYDFVNWTASGDGTATFTDASATSTHVTVNNGSVTVTANAVAKTTTLNLWKEDGTGTYTQATATYGQPIQVTIPVRTGYTFNGYYITSGTGTSGTQIIKSDGTFVKKYSNWVEEYNWVRTDENKDLYAHWTATKSNQLTLSKNFTTTGTHTGTNGSAYITFDATAFTDYVAATSSTGFTLLGYALDNKGTTMIADADGNFLKDVEGYTDVDGKWINPAFPSGTIYAIWEEALTTLTIAANEPTWGTLKYNNKTTDVDWGMTTPVGVDTQSKNIIATAKTGYIFTGWTIPEGDQDKITYTTGGTTGSIVVNGTGIANSTATIQANFIEDLSSNWYLAGTSPMFPNGWNTGETNMMKRATGHSTENVYYFTIHVDDKDIKGSGQESTYQFKIRHYKENDCNDYFGSDKDGNHFWVNQTSTMTLGKNHNDDNLYFIPTVAGDYEFKVDATNGANVKLTVTWPIYNCVYGDFDNWDKTAHKLNFGDGNEASTTVNITDVSKSYAFLVLVNSNYFTYKTATITRGTASNVQFASKADADANAKFTPDVAGDYTFTYNKSTNKLTITYPALPTASTSSTEKRIFNESELSFIDSGDGTEVNPYKIYTDEALTIDITALAPQTNLTAKYQFGEEEATTDVLSKTITNPSTEETSIVVKAFYESDGVAGTAWTKTIWYQGVPTPTIALSTTQNEYNILEAPDQVMISYRATNYTSTATITRDDVEWQAPSSDSEDYTDDLGKTVQAHTYKATATVNDRTFTSTLVVSVYKMVKVKVADENSLFTHFYMWRNGMDKTGPAWPGETFSYQVGTTHIFYVKYPTFDRFVLNNGKQPTESDAKQTEDIVLPEDDACYAIGTQDQTSKKYACTTADCPNGLYVKDIEPVAALVGEGVLVSPQVDIEPGLDESTLVITFDYTSATGISCDQRGRSFMVTATQAAVGKAHTVGVTYSIDGAESVTKQVTVNVTEAVMIQAKYGDLGWSDHNQINIHYWGTGVNGTINMTWKDYDNTNKQDRVYARIPLGSDSKINFQIYAWNMDDDKQWHITKDVTEVTASGCYTITPGDENQKRNITRDEGGLCWTAYYVEVDMNNGTVYRSNTVESSTETVSFFAPGASETGYKQGLVRIMENGSQKAIIDASAFATSGVYTAKILANGEGLSDVALYTGDYYIRTDGASGRWDHYKEADKDNKFTKFDKIETSTYDRYWVKNLKPANDNPKVNLQACVANDYNENLANKIVSSSYTDGNGDVKPDVNGVNVRFGYDPSTNNFERAIIMGAASDAFLNVIGDNVYKESECTTLLNSQNANSKFADKEQWIYEKDVYVKIDATHTASVAKLQSKDFNGNVMYQLGFTIDPNTGKATTTPKTFGLIAVGTTEGTYKIHLVYDFKTNRMVSGWTPEGEISGNIVLDADMLLVRNHQEKAQQIHFSKEDASIRQIKHIYGVMEIEKDKMTAAASATMYELHLYWISFPFDVKVSSIFGVGTYGKEWKLQRYDGAERASKGWFKGDGTTTFWKDMTLDETMNANEGYILSLKPAEFDKADCAVWNHGRTVAAFYFPSVLDNVGLVKAANFAQDVPKHECKIDREFEVENVGAVNHKNTDSHWNVIGVPAFEDAAPQTSSEGFHSVYRWIPSTNTYEAQVVSTDFKLQTMYAYMVQYAGTINWQNVSVITKAPYQYADAKNYMIELFFSNGEAEDHTYINLADEASTDFVLNEDMMKIDNAGFPNIYSFAGAYNVAYNGTKFDNQTVMLGVSAPKNGTYTFAMPKDFSGKALLVDLESGETTDLNMSDYTVELNKGTYNNRFQLVLEVEAKAPTAIDNVDGGLWRVDGKTKKLLINDNIYLINGGRIYNASGTKVR